MELLLQQQASLYEITGKEPPVLVCYRPVTATATLFEHLENRYCQTTGGVSWLYHEQHDSITGAGSSDSLLEEIFRSLTKQ